MSIEELSVGLLSFGHDKFSTQLLPPSATVRSGTRASEVGLQLLSGLAFVLKADRYQEHDVLR